MHDCKRRSWVRRTSHIVAALVLAGSAVTSGTLLAAGGGVHGKVVGWEKLIPQTYSEAAADLHRYTWREPSPTVKSDFRKLSANVSRDVCIVAIGAAAAQAHDPLAVRLSGGRLTPSTIVLAPGSRLSFKNADPFPHQLYEVGDEKWAANPTAPGSTREWAAGAAPGVHVIRDQLFPSVVMYVTVDPNAAEYTFPDRDGAFNLQVPPGDYTVKAFFEGKQVGKSVENVHVGGGALDLRDFSVAGGGESK
jgi:hypothetical protein